MLFAPIRKRSSTPCKDTLENMNEYKTICPVLSSTRGTDSPLLCLCFVHEYDTPYQPHRSFFLIKETTNHRLMYANNIAIKVIK